SNALALKGWSVQKEHCVLELVESGVCVTPLGQSVVRLNGRRIDGSQTLNREDVLQIAQYCLAVDWQSRTDFAPTVSADETITTEPGHAEAAGFADSSMAQNEMLASAETRSADDMRRLQIQVHHGLIRYLERRRIDVNTLH